MVCLPFFLSSILLSIHRSDLTTVSPTLPAFFASPPLPDLSHSPQGQCRHPFCCLGDVSHFSGLAGWWVWESVRRRGGGGSESTPGSKQMTRDWSGFLLPRAAVTPEDQVELPVALATSDKSWTSALGTEKFPRHCWPSAAVEVVREKVSAVSGPMEMSTSPFQQCGFGCHAQTSGSMGYMTHANCSLLALPLSVSLPICGWTRHWRMANIAVVVHVTFPCAFGLLSRALAACASP